MPLTNTQLYYYDSNVLRLPHDQRKTYHAQVDRLVSELSKSIRDKAEIKITRVVKAGSFAKFTILRKTSVDPIDVDVVFYISGMDVAQETLTSLTDTIYSLLIKIYPNKDVEHFQIQRKAATVTFVGSGLSVDIVPVIQDDEHPTYGWQFDLKSGSKVKTCAPCQIQFARQARQEVAKSGRAKASQVVRDRTHHGLCSGQGGFWRFDRTRFPTLFTLHRPVRLKGSHQVPGKY